MRSDDRGDQFTGALCEIMYTPNISRNKLLGIFSNCKYCLQVGISMVKWQIILRTNHLSADELTVTRNSVSYFKTTPLNKAPYFKCILCNMFKMFYTLLFLLKILTSLTYNLVINYKNTSKSFGMLFYLGPEISSKPY